MVNHFTNINKTNHNTSLQIIKSGKPGPNLDQASIYVELNPFCDTPTSLLDTDMNKQKNLHRFTSTQNEHTLPQKWMTN